MTFDEYNSQATVKAEQIEEQRSVITPQGAVTALPGQWEVRYPDGNVRVLDDEAFQAEWGGESGDSEPGAEDTQPTLMDATADNGSLEPTPPETTADADSASVSSQDSDSESDSAAQPKRRRSKSRDEEDDEPPV